MNWKAQKQEAQYCVRRGILPHKIPTKHPLRLAQALRDYFLKEKLYNVGTTVDPDKDGVWIRKK